MRIDLQVRFSYKANSMPGEAESEEQRAESEEQRAESEEQRAGSEEQRAESKERRAKSGEWGARGKDRGLKSEVSKVQRKKDRMGNSDCCMGKLRRTTNNGQLTSL